MKHVNRRARFQQHREASFQQVLFQQCKVRKENHAILKEILGEHAPSYATVKKVWSIRNVVTFSSLLRLVLEDPKQ